MQLLRYLLESLFNCVLDVYLLEHPAAYYNTPSDIWLLIHGDSVQRQRGWAWSAVARKGLFAAFNNFPPAAACVCSYRLSWRATINRLTDGAELRRCSTPLISPYSSTILLSAILFKGFQSQSVEIVLILLLQEDFKELDFTWNSVFMLLNSLQTIHNVRQIMSSLYNTIL